MSVDVPQQLTARFQELVRTPEMAAPEMAGVAAATACAQVLPVAGVGLGLLHPPWRAPIGGSSSDAVAAERLQFTVGEGPCLRAHYSQETVRASTATLSRRWPVLAAELADRTPFRAILGAPLTGWLAGLGTMNVYFTDDQAMTQLNTGDVTAALDTVGSLLAGALGPRSQSPAFLDAAVNRARQNVMVATGIVVVHLAVSFRDALDVLRGYAFRTGRDLDSVAADMLCPDLVSRG